MNKYDVTIIGAGPCGYIAAIWAARSGLTVAVAEKEFLGGTCLNWGCIPTKVLLNIAEIFCTVKEAGDYGIKVSSPQLDYAKVFEKKEKVVSQLRAGIESLFKARKINLFRGEARLLDAITVGIGGERIVSKNILIATGSRASQLPALKFDAESVISSGDAVRAGKLPESILIVGGGAIGCEYATLYNSFGKQVTIVEMLDNLLPALDSELGKRLEVIFRQRGIKVITKAKVEKVIKKQKGAEATLSNGETCAAEKILVSVGRRPNTENLGLEKIGIALESGNIITDEYLRTGVSGIYAGGDVIGGILLAHVASHEGITAIDNMQGKNKKIDYNTVPNCIFTTPEIATVGLSEKEAKSVNKDIKVSRFPYAALGKAHAIGKTEGFVKIVGESSTGKILGMHIMGAHATDLIAEAVLAIKNGFSCSDLTQAIHAHPTLSEGISEAAYNFYGKGLHLV